MKSSKLQTTNPPPSTISQPETSPDAPGCWALRLRPFALGLGAISIIAALAGCAESHKLSEVRTRYDVPLLSPGTMFAGLPATVQHTIRAETGGEPIEDIVQDTGSGGKYYRVYFESYEANPPLYVAADGSVLNYDLSMAIPAPVDSGGVLLSQPISGLKVSELPPEVVQTLQTRSGGADIQSITKEVRAGGTVYIIKFRDHRLPELYIASEGDVVKEVSK